MPLSAKGRIEVYVPDLVLPIYHNLLLALDNEFTFNFGGCSIIHGIDGRYLSKNGENIPDRINLIYTDTPYSFEENLSILETYADRLRAFAFNALNEEAILVALWPVYHSVE
ncbi:hypothetical protein BH10ACI2_BH10ACI2_23950 [soil metagenome]